MRTKRIDLIERYIEEEKLVSLDVLCEKFAVSKNTIRRDIEELVKKGVVEKVYGGVSFKAPASDTRLVPYEERHTVLSAENFPYRVLGTGNIWIFHSHAIRSQKKPPLL